MAIFKVGQKIRMKRIPQLISEAQGREGVIIRPAEERIIGFSNKPGAEKIEIVYEVELFGLPSGSPSGNWGVRGEWMEPLVPPKDEARTNEVLKEIIANAPKLAELEREPAEV